MGGAVSAGEDNDNLVENLVEANYIRTATLIDVFRAVDRGHYYLKDQRNSAYHDIAWKSNHLHLSAPCIYSEVLEHLELKPSMSFLNLGSGTGYLSTMAGLILGPYGVNHGIEIHEDVVDYAHEKLKEYIAKAPAFDRFEFCHPQFEVGNCLLLPPDTPGYDRVYCGAACPSEYSSYLMNLLKIGGKLVLPLDDQLQVKTRTGEQEWDSRSALAVSFAHLILPDSSDKNQKSTPIPERRVLPLRELCRYCIRRVIRDQYGVEMPAKRKRKKRERHKSVGIEEQIVSRYHEVHMRRRRINTIGESGSVRRRRLNTSGESDHAYSSADSRDSSDNERDSDDEMEMTEQTDVVDDDVKDDAQQQQNELAENTNDITLDDTENGKKEKGEPMNGLPESSNKEDEGRGKDDSSTSGGPPRNHSKRYHFRFLRSRPNSRTLQQGGDAPTTSDRTDAAGSEARAQVNNKGEEGGDNAAEQERQVVRPPRRSRLAYVLLRGLRRRIEERQAGTRTEERISEKEGSDSAHSEHDSEKELDSVKGSSGESEPECEEIFKPLAETRFTIAIRKLPLPPSLINFLLYYRQ